MNKKVCAKRHGIVHYIAMCKDCSKDWAIFSDGLETPADVRRALKNHISETGHSVSVVSLVATTYSLE